MHKIHISDPNICHLLDLATTLLPSEVDQTVCLKTAVLITTIFSKNLELSNENVESKCYYEYVCLKLSLYLLGLADNNNDNRGTNYIFVTPQHRKSSESEVCKHFIH